MWKPGLVGFAMVACIAQSNNPPPQYGTSGGPSAASPAAEGAPPAGESVPTEGVGAYDESGQVRNGVVGDGGRGTCTSGVCNMGCPDGQCAFICKAGSTCNLSCAGGSCMATCTGDAVCNVSCAGGACTTHCQDNATCNVSCDSENECYQDVTDNARLTCTGGKCGK